MGGGGVSAGLVTFRKYTPMEITIIRSRAMTLNRSPQCRAFSRAVTDGKSLSPLFHVGGGSGAVDTNDWCIMGRNYVPMNMQDVVKIHYFSGTKKISQTGRKTTRKH